MGIVVQGANPFVCWYRMLMTPVGQWVQVNIDSGALCQAIGAPLTEHRRLLVLTHEDGKGEGK